MSGEAALGLIVIVGAIQKKIFVWHTGFWGERSFGWHYDLMLLVMNLVLVDPDFRCKDGNHTAV